jgi:hypothetical protein
MQSHVRPSPFALLVCSLLLFSSPLFADGKFYRERVPPGIPYQRALLVFSEGKEKLVLQSKFQESQPTETPSTAETSKDSPTLGWVVPVPSLPDVSSMSAVDATIMFRILSRISAPSITRLPLFEITICLLVLGAIVCWALRSNPRLREKHGRRLIGLAALFLVVAIIVWGGTPTLLGVSGVEVVSAKDVGIFHVKVIQAKSSTDLVAWLNEGGFKFGQEDISVFNDYIQRGWCFVVAKVRSPEEALKDSAPEGLVDPLVLSFDSKVPVYPLALTGTSLTETKVLLYTLTEEKMDCGNRLRLEYAGCCDEKDFLYEYKYISWPLNEREKALHYLCKFKGTLKPEQMKTDLELRKAADDAPYRAHYWPWSDF